MSAFRLPATSDHIAPPAVEPTLWLNVLVELEQPAPADLANRNRSQRYALLAERTGQQRAELEMWIVNQELDDEVLSISEMEAMGILLIQCSRAVAAQLPEAPGVASVAVTGCNDEVSKPTALRHAYA